VLYSCAGEITEKDIDFASTSNATLLSFNTTLASGAKKAAKMADLIIREFDVIYDLFDYVESLIENLVGPQYQETFTGSAVVKTVFPLAKSFVAGSSVSEGKLLKDSFIHVLRNDEIVYKGQISSLKQMKSDVSEVSQGSECGIFTDGFDSWKQGDIINAFELSVKKKKSL
jgi:translation initiation factor IF-2